MKTKKKKHRNEKPASGKLVFSKAPDGSLVAGPLPKKYWQGRSNVPEWSVEAKCRLAEQDGDVVAPRLARLTGWRSLPLEYLATCEDYLEEVGLDISDVTPTVIHRAQKLIDESTKDIIEWVKEKGGTWNGVGARSEEYDEPSKPESNGSITSTPTNRSKLFSMSISSVIRRLGYEGFDLEMTQKVLDHYNISLPTRTINGQLWCGRKGGSFGKPADLTDEQLNDLFRLAGG